MRAAREARDAASEDLHALRAQFHEMVAAKEEAERELGAAVAQLDQVRGDWQRKLRDRRKEIGVMERRLAGEAAEAAVQQEREAKRAQEAEKDRQDYLQRQQALHEEAWSAEAVEKLQAAEALWVRLQSLSGGSTPEGIAAAWQGMCVPIFSLPPKP